MAVNLSSLPPDTARFVTGIVSSGKYSSVDDVVVAALKLFEDRERSLGVLRKQIDDGVEDFGRGDYIEVTDEAGHRALFDALKAEVLNASQRGGRLP